MRLKVTHEYTETVNFYHVEVQAVDGAGSEKLRIVESYEAGDVIPNVEWSTSFFPSSDLLEIIGESQDSLLREVYKKVKMVKDSKDNLFNRWLGHCDNCLFDDIEVHNVEKGLTMCNECDPLPVWCGDCNEHKNRQEIEDNEWECPDCQRALYDD